MEQMVGFEDIEFGTPTDRPDPTWGPPQGSPAADPPALKNPADRSFRRSLYETSGRLTFLYIAYCEGFAKVGVSEDPRTRVFSMQAGCPFEITLVESYPLSRADAMQAEIDLFQALRDHHARGEWFQCSLATVRYAALEVVRNYQRGVVAPPVIKTPKTRKPPAIKIHESSVTKRVWVTPAGEFTSLAAAAEHHGVEPRVISSRMSRLEPGWFRKIREQKPPA
jgi:hypothetical protein